MSKNISEDFMIEPAFRKARDCYGPIGQKAVPNISFQEFLDRIRISAIELIAQYLQKTGEKPKNVVLNAGYFVNNRFHTVLLELIVKDNGETGTIRTNVPVNRAGGIEEIPAKLCLTHAVEIALRKLAGRILAMSLGIGRSFVLKKELREPDYVEAVWKPKFLNEKGELVCDVATEEVTHELAIGRDDFAKDFEEVKKC